MTMPQRHHAASAAQYAARQGVPGPRPIGRPMAATVARPVPAAHPAAMPVGRPMVPQQRQAVTSPAGTTIAAVRELERHGVRAALLAAIEAARDRSVELGDH